MRGDSVTFWNGELPAGRYTVVAWGNLENEETVTDSRMLTANGGTPPAYRGNTDRLYYGSATFETVDGEVCRRRSTSPKRMPCSISRWNGAPPYYRPKQGFFGCGCVGYTDRTVLHPPMKRY